MMRALGYEAKEAKAALTPSPSGRLDPRPTDVVLDVLYCGDMRLTIELGFPRGRIAQLDTGFVLKGDACYQSYTVLGEDARIWVPAGSAQRETYRQGIVVDTSYHIVRAAGLAIEKVDVPGVHQWQLEAEYFAERVLKSESIQYPAENGLANAKVIVAIYRSAWEQREIGL